MIFAKKREIEIKFSDYADKWLILFFYPLDFTFVCPTEIIAFSDAAKSFREINCEVVAASCDSQFTHLAWMNQPKKEGGLGEVDIPIIADTNHALSKAFGVLKKDEGIPYRGLFIIDNNVRINFKNHKILFEKLNFLSKYNLKIRM